MKKRITALCLANFAALIMLVSCGGKNPPTETLPDGTVAPQPHDTILPPETEEIPPETTVLDTEPVEPDLDELGRKQAICDQRVQEIVDYIKSHTPVYQREIEAETDAETTAETDTAPTETEAEYEDYTPAVTFCYLDLESGATMSHLGDKVLYSASLIKQPYILWALKTIEAEEAEADFEAGSTYDVTRIFTYDEKNYRAGSGIIKNSEYGTEYTYLDLLRLTITKSDNVAFYQLRKEYGLKDFYAYCESLGVKSPQRSLYNLSAAECAIFLGETYEYFESGSKYANLLREWMQGTNHRIMLPHALKSPVANKYGWDVNAYHDMGVVFHEHPYVLVIMTELDNGSNADNAFIRNLAKRVEAVHEEINSLG